MAVEIKRKKFDGLDKELLLVGEGYIARPVTVNKDTVAGLTPTDKGRYIIPYGTYLYGTSGSLLANPQQVAKEVVPTVTRATLTVNTSVKVTAKQDGAVAHTIEFYIPTGQAVSNPSVEVSGGATKAIKVNLACKADGTIKTTYAKVVELINNDTEANTYIKAELVTGVTDDVLAAVAASAPLAGGGAMAVSGDIDGILYHSVDVTEGENTGALIIHGYINVDNLPQGEPGDAVKAKLPHIVFGRRD